jgi:hypothetical protein
MAYATRGIAASFVGSMLALAACGGGDPARGGGPAENQGNMLEQPFQRTNGVIDTPSRDSLNDPASNAPGPHENAVNARTNVGNDI